MEFILDEMGLPVDMGVDADGIFVLALHAAAYRGHGEAVLSLLDRGASAEKVGNSLAPVHMACLGGQSRIVELLHQCGAELHEIVPDWMSEGTGLEHTFIDAATSGSAKVVRYILEHTMMRSRHHNDGLRACCAQEKFASIHLLLAMQVADASCMKLCTTQSCEHTQPEFLRKFPNAGFAVSAEAAATLGRSLQPDKNRQLVRTLMDFSLPAVWTNKVEQVQEVQMFQMFVTTNCMEQALQTGAGAAALLKSLTTGVRQPELAATADCVAASLEATWQKGLAAAGVAAGSPSARGPLILLEQMAVAGTRIHLSDKSTHALLGQLSQKPGCSSRGAQGPDQPWRAAGCQGGGARRERGRRQQGHGKHVPVV